MFDILDTVDTWLDENKPVALATVTETWGSSPRQAGAVMAIGKDLSMTGSVSGGCVETAVVEEAVRVIKQQHPVLLRYGVSDETAWDVGLACGGNVSVFVEPLAIDWWREISTIIRNHGSAVTLTILSGPAMGEKAIIADNTLRLTTTHFPLEYSDQILSLAQLVLRTKITEVLPLDRYQILVQTHVPPARLVIIGGAHISQALACFAALMDFQIIVIDPRTVFSTEERFPEAHILRHDYPDEALKELGIDSETYVAVLTHDPKIDDRALIAVLPGNAAYIGVLSGKRSQEMRLKRLTEAGVDPALFQRMHVPVGITIGATTPEEIALSILAEIVAVRRGVRV